MIDLMAWLTGDLESASHEALTCRLRASKQVLEKKATPCLELTCSRLGMTWSHDVVSEPSSARPLGHDQRLSLAMINDSEHGCNGWGTWRYIPMVMDAGSCLRV